MRVLVAGGTGAIGRALVPLLQEVGHDVVLLSRPGTRPDVPGVDIVEADAVDREAVRRTVRNAAPDAVVNVLTAIPRPLIPKRFAQEMVMTDRLRLEGTANLVGAAGSTRFVSEGLAFAYRPDGDRVADEGRGLLGRRPKSSARRSVRSSSSSGSRARPVDSSFGSATSTGRAPGSRPTAGRRAAPGGADAGGGEGQRDVLVHPHPRCGDRDRRRADKPVRGALNVVDHEPTYARDWIPALAQLIGAGRSEARTRVHGPAHGRRLGGRVHGPDRRGPTTAGRASRWTGGRVPQLAGRLRSHARSRRAVAHGPVTP